MFLDFKLFKFKTKPNQTNRMHVWMYVTVKQSIITKTQYTLTIWHSDSEININKRERERERECNREAHAWRCWYFFFFMMMMMAILLHSGADEWWEKKGPFVCSFILSFMLSCCCCCCYDYCLFAENSWFYFLHIQIRKKKGKNKHTHTQSKWKITEIYLRVDSSDTNYCVHSLKPINVCMYERMNIQRNTYSMWQKLVSSCIFRLYKALSAIVCSVSAY